jgi:hypothetical protein
MPQTGYLCWCHLAQKLEFCKGKHQMLGAYNFVSNLLIYPEDVYPPLFASGLLSPYALFCRSLSYSIPLYPSSWFVHVHFLLFVFHCTNTIHRFGKTFSYPVSCYLYEWSVCLIYYVYSLNQALNSASILIVGLQLAQWKQTGPRWMIRHTFMDLAK